MRQNGPVTQREVFMKEGSAIVSRTDDKGRIKFVNEDFVEISGFARDELIGQPHNLIRHSDMPPEAFEDMWRDLKAGKPWSGYVKNRVKNGDHYWVEANAMPVIEQGVLAGYISIRNKPDPSITKTVGDIYKKFLSGEAKGLWIEHGRIVEKSRKAQMNRWFSMIKNKILCVSAVLCLLVAMIGGAAIYFIHDTTNQLKQMFYTEVMPMNTLSEISQLMYENALNVMIISTNTEKSTELEAKIQTNSEKISKDFADLEAMNLTAEEKKLIKKFQDQRDVFRKQAIQPALALAKKGRASESTRVISDQYPAFDQAMKANGQLLDLQMKEAQIRYDDARKQAIIDLLIFLGIIATGIAVAYLSSHYLGKTFNERLDYVDTRLNSIMGGNYMTDIQVTDNEMQNTLTTIKALQAKLSYGELEKKELERQKKEMQAKMADDFEQSVKTIVNVVASAATELAQTAESMVSTAQNSAEKASSANGEAASATANVQSVAAASEELSSTVQEIAEQMQKTRSLVNDSLDKTQNADSIANTLNDATNKVASAMNMIAEISGQINLLSLNATIESARAGEAGKGFAVVAGEVKNLANQTNKTTEEIQLVVVAMRQAAQNIIDALKEVNLSVGSISSATSNVAAAVEEQSAATNEIARNMQTASSNTQSIADSLKDVEAASAQAGLSSEQMLVASRELSKQAVELNSQVDHFLQRVRAE